MGKGRNIEMIPVGVCTVGSIGFLQDPRCAANTGMLHHTQASGGVGRSCRKWKYPTNDKIQRPQNSALCWHPSSHDASSMRCTCSFNPTTCSSTYPTPANTETASIHARSPRRIFLPPKISKRPPFLSVKRRGACHGCNPLCSLGDRRAHTKQQ